MARNSDSSYEEETQSDSSRDRNVHPRRPHKGGKKIREEPIRLLNFLHAPLPPLASDTNFALSFVRWLRELSIIIN